MLLSCVRESERERECVCVSVCIGTCPPRTSASAPALAKSPDICVSRVAGNCLPAPRRRPLSLSALRGLVLRVLGVSSALRVLETVTLGAVPPLRRGVLRDTEADSVCGADIPAADTSSSNTHPRLSFLSPLGPSLFSLPSPLFSLPSPIFSLPSPIFALPSPLSPSAGVESAAAAWSCAPSVSATAAASPTVTSTSLDLGASTCRALGDQIPLAVATFSASACSASDLGLRPRRPYI